MARSGKKAGKALRSTQDRIGAVRQRLHERAKTVPGPSTNPITNIIIADIALRGGSMLLRKAVEKSLLTPRAEKPADPKAPAKSARRARAKKIANNRSFTQNIVSGTVAKLATRSVPGAIVVGGGLLAKTLYDRAKGAEKPGATGQKLLKKPAEGDD
ncbi:hypothetical protein RXV95_04000 [Novosphingobium sp. ZN18A2]|uniref:hypothetical protein n=1 Tax=Novosphingobium sp. ZN18A2 TaxID=3079861 RepID=UPI0030D52F0D